MKRIADIFFVGKLDGGGVNLQVGDGEGAQIVALSPEQWQEALDYLGITEELPDPTEDTPEPAGDGTDADGEEKGGSDTGEDPMITE